jgi:hypothetical protein
MTPPEYYRKRAADCFALADQISDPFEGEIMHELGLQWLRLLDWSNETQGRWVADARHKPIAQPIDLAA